MNVRKLALFLPMLLLAAGSGWSATRYGDAVIEQGSMIIVREGHSLRYDQPNTPIEVNEDDLIRVRPDSEVELRSKEKATVTLGPNAVFHVKPWQAREKTGFLRALFGRFRASIVGLTGGEAFNVKTATATIGVKGTKYYVQVTNRGGTLVVTHESTVGFQGQRGGEVPVNENFISLIININPPTEPGEVPDDLQDEFSGRRLGSGPPNGPNGGTFAGARGLVRAGLVSQKDLDEGQGDGGPPPSGFTPPGLEFDPNEASETLNRGRVGIRFVSP